MAEPLVTPEVQEITEQPQVNEPVGMIPESESQVDPLLEGNSGLVDEFFRVNKEAQEQPVSAEPSPVPMEPVDEVPQQATAEPTDVDNDIKRYQYWQSETDKARNEIAALKDKLNTVETQQAQQPQVTEKEESAMEQFPPPPEKPKKPSGFNRADAYDDNSSDSAKYLDSMDEWRDNMDEYNRLHSQYTVAVMEEEKGKLKKERDSILKQQAEREAYNSNMQKMSTHLTEQYQATPEEIQKFVEVMDNPENITVDNLFQLYRMQNGGNMSPTNAPPVAAQTPSNESFEQRKRAQSVPSPMGVVPGQTQAGATDESTSMMDSMLNDYKKRNPWS